MDIKKALAAEHSKSQTAKIVRYIGDDSKRFADLMRVFLVGESDLSRRAAWAMSNIAIDHPELVKPYLGKLVQKLRQPGHHPAIARNILRILQDVDVPEKYQGDLIDECFKLIAGEIYPAAVRAFAITAAGRICKHYPELKNELLILLKHLHELPQLPAIRHRIKKALKEI